MKKPEAGNKETVDNYLKYSSLGIQIALIAGVMAFIGVKLDDYLKNETPWFTLIFSIVGVTGAMIKLIRSIK